MVGAIRNYEDNPHEWGDNNSFELNYLLNPSEIAIGVEDSRNFYVKVKVLVDEALPANTYKLEPLFVHTLEVPNHWVEFYAPDTQGSADNLVIGGLASNVEVKAFRLEDKNYLFAFKNLPRDTLR